MHRTHLGKLLVLILVLAMAGKTVADDAPFAGTPLAPLAAFIGNWEINTTWADGTSLWSRNEFTVGLGGRFLEARTFAKDGDGDVYERYRTVYGVDPDTGELISYGFTNDGSVTIVDNMTVEEDGPALTSEWSGNGTTIRQTVRFTSADEYNWKVWMRGDDDWTEIMNANWQRVAN